MSTTPRSELVYDQDTKVTAKVGAFLEVGKPVTFEFITVVEVGKTAGLSLSGFIEWKGDQEAVLLVHTVSLLTAPPPGYMVGISPGQRLLLYWD